jgi:TolA-binding protein
MRFLYGRLGSWIATAGLALWAGVAAQAQELSLSDEDFKKLDTFEGASLAKADKVFGDKDYRRAGAEYDAFVLQFAKSPALAYAVFRKARALHLDNKRYEAIRGYTEVLDYFPNHLLYAGAALYYLGAAHWENGDLKEAMKAWAEMAEDVDYRKHYLAAGAINRLADQLAKEDKPQAAVEYYKQVAVDFRTANRDAARYAIEKAVYHYIRTEPNEAKLREFYEKARTFEWDPNKPEDGNYWQRVRENIRRYGDFPEAAKDQREDYFRYWARAMAGKFPEWDDYQVDLADFQRVYEGDLKKWMERYDQQYAKYQKDGDYGRTIKWVNLYRDYTNKVEEYYGKLTFEKMSNGQIIELLRVLYDSVRSPGMAKNVFFKLKLGDMKDGDLYNLARFLWGKDTELVERACDAMDDQDYARMEKLRYYHWARIYAKGMPLADEMLKNPAFAREANWMKAEMFHWQGKYPEAIAAYQMADNPPQNLWRIVDCFLAQGKRDQALAQLREIENFFADQAPQAALRIAYVYRDAGDKKQQIAALRGVMTKYPKSGESSQAHQDLEALGFRIGGGVDAE